MAVLRKALAAARTQFGNFVLAFAMTFILNFLLFPVLAIACGFAWSVVQDGYQPGTISGLPLALLFGYSLSAIVAFYAILPGFLISMVVFLVLWAALSKVAARKPKAWAFAPSVTVGAFSGLVSVAHRFSQSPDLAFDRNTLAYLSPAATAFFVGLWTAGKMWPIEGHS